MKVLALVYPGMTLQDLLGPIQAWSLLPNYEIQFAWHEKGPLMTDCGMIVHATHCLDDCWESPDVLMVGGGTKPTLDLMGDQKIMAFLAGRGHKAKWVTSVCTGSLLLGAAGLLKGYRASTHWGAREQLAQFCAEVSEERVCIDRNRLTGGGVTSGIDFGIAIAGMWAGEPVGRMIELVLEYAPKPPYDTGRPELADPATLAAGQQALKQAMGV